MFASPTETLDLAEKLVHVFGTPALIGVVVWLVRTYDGGQRALKNIQTRGDESALVIADTKAAVDLMASNHLSHIATDIKSLSNAQDRSNDILGSIDKGIAVLVDRSSRDIVIETKLKQV